MSSKGSLRNTVLRKVLSGRMKMMRMQKGGMLGFAMLLFLLGVVPGVLRAQEQPLQEFFVGTILHVDAPDPVDEDFLVEGVLPVRRRTLRVELDPPADPRVVDVAFDETLITNESQLPAVGDRVVVSRNPNYLSDAYLYVDAYRLPRLAWLGAAFALLVVAIAGRRGIAAMGGLLASIFVIFAFVAPQLIRGLSPLLVGLAGSVVIVVVSMGITHGFSRRTRIAIGSVLLALLLTTALGAAAVSFTHLLGFGDEAAVHIRLSSIPLQDLTGLLLAAIIIGTLGVIDDVAITQVTFVKELHETDGTLSVRELFRRAHNVGREHIAAVVNTLVLAYVGASLPLFVLLYANRVQPTWVLLNNETLAEEIVRSLVGSMGLVLAVPIATLLAARAFGSRARSLMR